MKLNSKGQVTIPASLRHKLGFAEGDEVDVVEDGTTLRIVRSEPGLSAAERWIRQVRGSASRGMSTDEVMRLTRGD